MIVAQVTDVSIRTVGEALRLRAKRIGESVQKEQNKISVDLQTYVKSRKLSGRPGLRNITGNLRRAINRKVITTENDIVAIVGVGPNASKYAKIHEFGGKIDVPEIEGKLMVFPADRFAEPGRLMTKSGKMRKGLKKWSLSQLVFTRKRRAFTVTMPQRSYLRSSLAEMKTNILIRLNQAVARAAKEWGQK